MSFENISITLPIQSFINHFVILVIIIIDYCSNAVPIVPRHSWLTFILSISYMFVNLISTLVRGKELYPGITWKDPAGIIGPILMVGMAVVVHRLLACCNNYKLRKLGHQEFIDKMNG